MKKHIKLFSIILVAAIMTAALAGCAERNRAPQVDEQDLTKETSVLVVYFTWSGHLDSMAHWIADETGGDILRVLAKNEYPESYDDTADRAKKEKDDGVRPEITVSLTAEQMAKYDTVFIGFPVWWYDLPMPMWTFLESVDLSGKTVNIFFSHEGTSDGGSALSTIGTLAKGATVNTDNALSIRGSKVKNSEEDVRGWVKGLGYSK